MEEKRSLMTNNILIKAVDIRKSFDDLKAVDGLSFQVERSECFGLLGPNGAGKTTMMNMIYGRTRRDKYSSSSLSISGYYPDLNPLEIKFLSGVVPQEDNLDEELNVLENLLLYSRFYGITGKKAKERSENLLEFMELSEKQKSRIRELSGGMKRRLIIARALLSNPRLLILDEPTTGLDPQVRHLIWDKIRKLKKEGTTILLTTHYMEEAFQICDKIIIMDKGKKLIEGEPHSLLRENMERYVLEIMDRACYAALESQLAARSVRAETAREVTYLYSNNIEDLRHLSSCVEHGGAYLRETNLEDLFLKSTGSKLNDEQ